MIVQQVYNALGATLGPLFWAGLGGCLGAMGRYSVSLLLSAQGGFPWATLWVNLLGCLLAGVILAVMTPEPTPARLFWLTGVLGGFTTFSAFSLETLQLWLSQQRLAAALNVGANLFGALVMVSLGWWLAKNI